MRVKGPEYGQVLRPAIELLQQVFGYEYAHGKSAEFQQERRNSSEIILTERLQRKLRQLNPEATAKDIEPAVAALPLPENSSLTRANQEVYFRLVQRRPLDSSRPAGYLRYFDFEQPHLNEFLLVEQFAVTGTAQHEVIDLAIFVNGIPLALIEARRVTERDALLRGIERFLHLQEPQGISRLFHTIHFLIALQKDDACFGAVGAGPAEFSRWDDCRPLSLDELRQHLRQRLQRAIDVPTAQDVLLAGLLAPVNLLSFLLNFAAFDFREAWRSRKLARVHQLDAVECLMQRLKFRLDRHWHERGGLVFHPGGAGKSFTLLWLAARMRRDPVFENHGLLLITDRSILMDRIKFTFEHSQLGIPVYAGDLAHLGAVLQRRPAQTVMCMDHLFRHEDDVIIATTPDPLIVLVDVYYWTDEFLLKLRRTFPNACLLLFTSPTLRNSARKSIPGLTEAIHVHSEEKTRQEHWSVPTRIESRLPEWHVWRTSLEPLRGDETLPPEERKQRIEKLEQKWKQAAKVPERFEAVAGDIHAHFNTNVFENGGQGLVVASSSENAARYYHALDQRLPGRIGILLDPPKRHQSELMQLYRTFRNRGTVVDRFQSQGAKDLALLIVAELPQRDLGVPALQVVYFDKPGNEQELLQAAGLTSRPRDGQKTCGLLVDYWGATKYLPAPAAESERTEARKSVVYRFEDAEFDELLQKKHQVFSFFPGYPPRDSTEPWVMALPSPEDRDVFGSALQDFFKVLDRLLPEPRLARILEDVSWLDKVLCAAGVFYSDTKLLAIVWTPKVQKVIAEYRKGEVSIVRQLVSIYTSEFRAQVEVLTTTEAKITRLKHALHYEVTKETLLQSDFYFKADARIQRIMNEWESGKVDDEKTLARLWEVADLLGAGETESAKKLGISTGAAALLVVLPRFLMPRDEKADEKLAPLAERLYNAMEPELKVVDWIKKDDLQREMRRKMKGILREENCPEGTIEPLATSLMALAHGYFGGNG